LDSTELPYWKRFQLFLGLMLLGYFFSTFLLSQNFLLREVRFSSYNPINKGLKEAVIGKSIHLINLDQIRADYLIDENVERVIVTKSYPYTLDITIEKFETLALITDYRTQSPIYYKLYKNAQAVRVLPHEISSLNFDNNIIEVINGPLDENVYGEFVNYLLLLRNTDSSIKTSFILNSNKLTGEIGDFTINFTSAVNLGKKASAVYQRLQEPCPSSSFTVDIDPVKDAIIVICNT